MPKAPWERDRGVEAVLHRWRSDPETQGCTALHHILPARMALPSPLPEGLSQGLRLALTARGITTLYAHQAQALALASSHHHLVVATPTASGKSLCYNLPVASRLTLDPPARALYLFPTKALARDQEFSLNELLRAAGLPAGVATCDGDISSDLRRAARDRASVVITNPDMLHAAILPRHAAWAAFFSHLQVVVIDELHVYTGVFGSHVANVIRRLRRIASFHGAHPVFLCASATVGNPGEHATRIVGSPVTSLTVSGAPSGPRHVVVYNPPIVNPDLGIRASYTRTAVRLTADLVRAQVPTLVFGQSRSAVETMLRYLRDRLVPEGVPEDSLQAYRGGYLPGTRRRIEQSLRDGNIRCVVATTALELGIDVGELDAVVCAGYPGTLADTWQRFGRAGRRGRPCVSVLVTSSAPVDQYLAREPGYLLGAPIEEARIDADNPEILLQHLRCGVFELPFVHGESLGDLGAGPTQDALEHLQDAREVHRSGDRWHWVAEGFPARDVSLRSIGMDTVMVVDSTRGETLASVDWSNAYVTVHAGAVYQHEGVPWQVDRLDADARKAWLSPARHDHFTDAVTRTRVVVLDENAQGTLPGLPLDAVGWGDVDVITQVVGYKKIRFHTHENLGYTTLDLPPVRMQTTAFWLVVPEALVDGLSATRTQDAMAGRPRVLDGLRGVAHALKAVASLAMMCAPRDLAYSLGDRHASTGDGVQGDAPPPGDDAPGSTVFLYDGVAGGVGLAGRAFERREQLLSQTLELISTCPCPDGCPACVSPGLDVGTFGRKRMALALLAALGVTRPRPHW